MKRVRSRFFVHCRVLKCTLASFTPPSIEELRGKPLFDQLFQQLETPYAVYILRRMDYAELEEFSQLMKQAIDSSGRENTGILNTIQKFLAPRGLKVIYNREVVPEPVDIDMEEFEMAEMTAEDESLSKSTTICAHICAHVY